MFVFSIKKKTQRKKKRLEQRRLRPSATLLRGERWHRREQKERLLEGEQRDLPPRAPKHSKEQKRKETRKKNPKKNPLELTGARRQQEDELVGPLGVVRVDLGLAVLAAGVAVDAAVVVAAEEAVVLEDVEEAGHLE